MASGFCALRHCFETYNSFTWRAVDNARLDGSTQLRATTDLVGFTGDWLDSDPHDGARIHVLAAAEKPRCSPTRKAVRGS